LRRYVELQREAILYKRLPTWLSGRETIARSPVEYMDVMVIVQIRGHGFANGPE